VDSAQNPGPGLLVVFDGHCGFCNRAVRWLLRRDRNDRLRFAASDSPKVADLLARHELAAPDRAAAPETIIVVRDFGGEGRKLLFRSDAVVALLRELPRPWPAAGAALASLPRPLRDLGYRLVARWRYRIWGRLEICPLPTAADREKFL
jgi:predicted DCC family thiol-disulfide oxidoreductase YuxK